MNLLFLLIWYMESVPKTVKVFLNHSVYVKVNKRMIAESEGEGIKKKVGYCEKRAFYGTVIIVTRVSGGF